MIFVRVDNYRIRRQDQMNIVLERRADEPMKKPPSKVQAEHEIETMGDGSQRFWRWTVLGYYPSLTRALKAFPDHLAADPQITTLESFYARWEKTLRSL